MHEVVLVFEDDAERAAKGVGPTRALLVEERRGFRPFDGFRDAREFGERLAAQSPDRVSGANAAPIKDSAGKP